MTALILVDMQNDFFPGGALEVKGGDEILPAVNHLLEHSFDAVVATKDWHPEGHISFAGTHKKNPGETIELDDGPQTLWPEHCVANTPGAKFAPGWPKEKVDKRIYKGTDPMIDSYSTFFDNGHHKKTGLDTWLKERGIHTLYLAGLATDYCVKYSALDAADLGYRVFVVTEGCKGVNLHPDDVKKAYREMRNKGIRIVSIDEVI
ncbi:MAG: bifunctional nicotinamidase/pyrazinamidase [Chlamydiia bacterium]|nr:bifunctional nicotinamidase/pyrazinamidase [Chlamydiia bacterium]